MKSSPARELMICEFNVENLFISLDYHEGGSLQDLSEEAWRDLALAQLRRIQKPLPKVQGVAKAIREIDADIYMLIEVGGADSLANLNRHFLDDRYIPYFIEGNARRAIDLGFLVKKDLAWRVESRSNREMPVEVNSYTGRTIGKFSRDVAELRLHDGDGLRLILLLTHLKSMISSEQDFRGKDLRTAEAFALAQLYEERRREFPSTPVVVGGDLNSDLKSLELEALRHTDLTDFHDVLGSTREERVSLVHFDYAGIPRPLVLDYLLVSPDLKERIVPEKSGTFRYRGFHGIPEPLPGSSWQRHRMPSDHYPLVLTVRL